MPTKFRLRSDGDISAGGDGIDAQSKAVAIAKVEQEAEQDNENSQEARRGVIPTSFSSRALSLKLADCSTAPQASLNSAC